jgi:hypothetical protein
MRTAVLSLGKSGRGVKLTTLLHLVLRLRKSTAIPPPPLCLSLLLSKMVQAVFAGFSPRRPVFNSRTVRVSIVVDKVAPGQVYPRVLRVSPASDIPPMFHTHSSMTDDTQSRKLTASINNTSKIIGKIKKKRLEKRTDRKK